MDRNDSTKKKFLKMKFRTIYIYIFFFFFFFLIIYINYIKIINYNKL